MSQLDSIFSKLKKSTSTIDDRISMTMINLMKSEIKPLLLNLINSTIRSIKFPQNLKISKIIPHFKKLYKYSRSKKYESNIYDFSSIKNYRKRFLNSNYQIPNKQ